VLSLRLGCVSGWCTAGGSGKAQALQHFWQQMPARVIRTDSIPGDNKNRDVLANVCKNFSNSLIDGLIDSA
jgi:hypothetical protein